MFPIIQTADTQNGTVTSNSTSWTITYPTNIAANDLLVLFAGIDGSAAGTDAISSGFTTYRTANQGAVGCAVLVKAAVGTETGTFTLTTPNEQGGWRIFRITDWYGSLANSAVGHSDGVGTGIATGDSSNPDPGSCDPNNWDVEDTLWFAACAADFSRTISAYPYADNNSADTSGGSNGASLGICTTTSAVASLDPGTFTISASDQWAALTVAVRPAAPVAAFAPPPRAQLDRYTPRRRTIQRT